MVTYTNEPREKCEPTEEQKCKIGYKLVEEQLYKQECHTDIQNVCEEHIEVPVKVLYPVKVPYQKYAHHDPQTRQVAGVPEGPPGFPGRFLLEFHHNPQYGYPAPAPSRDIRDILAEVSQAKSENLTKLFHQPHHHIPHHILPSPRRLDTVPKHLHPSPSTPSISTPLHSTPSISTPLHSTPLHSTPLHSTPSISIHSIT
jgi:hypothetical protein